MDLVLTEIFEVVQIEFCFQKKTCLCLTVYESKFVVSQEHHEKLLPYYKDFSDWYNSGSIHLKTLNGFIGLYVIKSYE